MVVISFVAIATGAIQDGQAPPESPVSATRGDKLNMFAELGDTLKAAVLSGTLSEEDAIRIYESLGGELNPDNEMKTDRADDGSDGPYGSKIDIMKLATPRPGQISTLFRAEFLRRDLRQYRRDLDLDQDQVEIIEILLRDYYDAFEKAAMPVRGALGRHRRTSADQWISETIQRARMDGVEFAVAKTRDALQLIESESEKKIAVGDATPDQAAVIQESRVKQAAWGRRMLEVAATMDERLAALRDLVQVRLDQKGRMGSMVSINEIVQMAQEFRRLRAQLREEFTESLGLIALIEQTDAELARLNTTLARVRIERDLSRGRLGGETMNLWAALMETTRAAGGRRGRGVELDMVKTRLDERLSALASTLQRRTEAAIDRELRGLDILATRDRLSASTGDPARLASALRPFVDASRRELVASVAVRDEVLALLDVTSALIDAAYPEMTVSRAYRDAAFRRGFKTEMRKRWSEWALHSALRLDDLDDESRGAIVDFEIDVAASLRRLRADAIARRIRRDPQLALQRIESQIQTGSSSKENFDLEDVLGFNHLDYTALDQRIENQLRSILTPEQFATLPIRPRVVKSGKAKASGREKTRE